METEKHTVFLTGATGFIGSRLALKLAGEGHTVHALIRNRKKAYELEHQGIKLFDGEVTETDAARRAMEGCTFAYHLAAFARPWSKDPDLPYRVNVGATAALLEAAKEQGVKRFVFTSSAATIELSEAGTLSDESTPRTTGYFNQYDRTKAQAEEVVRAANAGGLETVIVNPSRVYGPGPLSVSNAMTRIMQRYLQGSWRIIPGNGKVIGNYVFVEDVLNGHILAGYHGRGGERYILGGENLTFDQVFSIIAKVTGRKYRLVHLPVPLMSAAARVMFHGARLFGAAPPITPGWVKKYMHHAGLSSQKAMDELGYRVTPFEEGTRITVAWIKKMKLG